MNNIIGKRIKERRLELGLTQRELADVTGLAKPTITRYETGEIKGIKLAVIEQLAHYLDVNPGWLVGKSEVKERQKGKVYLLEKDKMDLSAIIDALLNYMEDGEKFYWKGTLMDVDSFNTVYNNLIGTQRSVDKIIAYNNCKLKNVDDTIKEIKLKEKEEPGLSLAGVDRDSSR